MMDRDIQGLRREKRKGRTHLGSMPAIWLAPHPGYFHSVRWHWPRHWRSLPRSRTVLRLVHLQPRQNCPSRLKSGCPLCWLECQIPGSHQHLHNSASRPASHGLTCMQKHYRGLAALLAVCAAHISEISQLRRKDMRACHVQLCTPPPTTRLVTLLLHEHAAVCEQSL